MKRSVSAIMALVIFAFAGAAMAQTPYSQDFEALVPVDGSLAADGWLFFGNVFDPGGGYLYGYGVFPAPNGTGGFCAIDAGQGGPAQGLQQLSVYSDYLNTDHGIGNLIESNVFQEQVIGIIERNKTFRVLGRLVDFCCIVDRHGRVPGRMHDQQSCFEGLDV